MIIFTYRLQATKYCQREELDIDDTRIDLQMYDCQYDYAYIEIYYRLYRKAAIVEFNGGEVARVAIPLL